MAEFTEHYDLIKPAQEDFYDVTDFNENMDAIDAQMAETEQEIEGVSEKIGEPSDTGSDTLFGCLQQLTGGEGGGVKILKSIQHIIVSCTTNGTTTKDIATVDPSRCVVLFERLFDGSDDHARIEYELSANTLKITHTTAVYYVTAGFWILEFY